MSEIFEQWRTVSDYPNYMVSNFGRIMNIKTSQIRNGFQNKVSGYMTISLNRKSNIYIHRLVAFAFLSVPDSVDHFVVDHIDRNKENNNASNLRWVSQSQNLMNAGKRCGITTSIYKGVCFKNREQKWQAKITIDSQEILIGFFDTQEEAAFRYNQKAKELFGEHACLNNVDYNPQIHTTKRKQTTSKFRGVCFQKNKWRARLIYKKNEILIGYFNTEQEAAEAYNKKAVELLGDKAKLNIFDQLENYFCKN